MKTSKPPATTLEDLLSQKQAAILDRWQQLVLDTYPADTSAFLKQEKDRFANPVGYTISHELESLFDGLRLGTEDGKLAASLDNIIRIRAIQDFSPSQAAGFTLLLKKALRDELGTEIREQNLFNELSGFESRIDSLTCLAFDIYARCREKVYQIRLGELKAGSDDMFRLLERAGLTSEEQLMPKIKQAEE